MAILKQTCSGCGADIEAHVGQSTGLWRLRFWISTDCPRCGAVTEADGDEAPEDVRRAILAEEGLWALHVEVGEKSMERTKIAVVLRKELGLSLPETAELKARLPGEVARGTPVEMADLRLRLAEHGVTSRVVLIEPGTVSAVASVKAPLCAGCTRHPEVTTCGRCGRRVCLVCRLPEYCHLCAFELVGEVLSGRRGPVGAGEAKVLRALMDGHNSDVRIDAITIERRSGAQISPDRHFGFLAPFTVGHLLDRAGITRLDGPTVAGIPKGPIPHLGTFAETRDLCVWFLPEPNELRILLRVRSELPPVPQPIPPDGPFALPPPVPSFVAPKRFREEATPRACPCCGKEGTRFRDLGDRLVCPACGRSFAVE